MYVDGSFLLVVPREGLWALVKGFQCPTLGSLAGLAICSVLGSAEAWSLVVPGVMLVAITLGCRGLGLWCVLGAQPHPITLSEHQRCSRCAGSLLLLALKGRCSSLCILCPMNGSVQQQMGAFCVSFFQG